MKCDVMIKIRVVLTMALCDRPDSPAVVIQSLSQADPFPCSVASLGRMDLFKALDPLAYAKEPMATRDLTWATGKRKTSASPLQFVAIIQPLSHVYRMYPGN